MYLPMLRVITFFHLFALFFSWFGGQTWECVYRTFSGLGNIQMSRLCRGGPLAQFLTVKGNEKI
jgi:hypothetical protein